MIYCANCLHCKVFTGQDRSGNRGRRVKCAKGLWLTPNKKEKTYSYHTVLSRRMRLCTAYESMGEATRDAFLRYLAQNLPAERGL